MYYYYKNFPISEYFVFDIIFIITTISLISNCKSQTVPLFSRGTIVVQEVEPINSECGTLTINSLNPQVHLALEEGLKIPEQIFLEITKKLVNASLVVNNGCRVEICGVSTSDYDCHPFSQSVSQLPIDPYDDLYIMTALSCACDKKLVICEKVTPGTGWRTCKDGFMDNNDCAILYQEIFCDRCYYNPISLKIEQTFRTDNSAAVKSIRVRPGCWISMSAKGVLWEDEPYVEFYREHQNKITPTFHTGLGGEEFYCTCYPGVLPGESGIIPVESDSWIIAAASASTVVILITVLGFVIYRRYFSYLKSRKLSATTPIVNADKIQGSENWVITNPSDEGMEILSVNYSRAKALVLPYDAKFEIPRNRFIIDVRNILGHGNYGIVYKGELNVSVDQLNTEYIDVAIKTLKPNLIGTGDYERLLKPLLNEIHVISSIGHHPNIVCFLGACTWNLRNGDVFNLTEFCGLGSLKDYLERIKIHPVQEIYVQLEINDLGYTKCDLELPESPGLPGRIDEDLFQLLLTWSGQIAAGMHYLSNRNVVHIDLAARNVFLTNDLVTKIGDFGLSRKLYSLSEYDKKGQDAVPVGWIALECMRDNKYSTKSDVWAYGIVLYEIFSFGAEPYDEKSGREIFAMLNSGDRLPCPAFATPEIYTIMKDCWKENPESRPSFRDLEEYFGSNLHDRKGNINAHTTC